MDTVSSTSFIYIFINIVLILFVLLSKFYFNYKLTFINWLLLYTLLFLFAYIYYCITSSHLSLDFFENTIDNTTYNLNYSNTTNDKEIIDTKKNIENSIDMKTIDKRILSNNLYDYNQQRLNIHIPQWDIQSFRESLCKDIPTYNCKLNSINCATRETIIK